MTKVRFNPDCLVLSLASFQAETRMNENEQRRYENGGSVFILVSHSLNMSDQDGTEMTNMDGTQ